MWSNADDSHTFTHAISRVNANTYSFSDKHIYSYINANAYPITISWTRYRQRNDAVR